MHQNRNNSTNRVKASYVQYNLTSIDLLSSDQTARSTVEGMLQVCTYYVIKLNCFVRNLLYACEISLFASFNYTYFSCTISLFSGMLFGQYCSPKIFTDALAGFCTVSGDFFILSWYIWYSQSWI